MIKKLALIICFCLTIIAWGTVYAQEKATGPRFMVIDSAFCETIPPGKKWCSQSSDQFDSSVRRVYCATKIFATGSGDIYHNWYYRGVKTDSVKLKVYTSRNYRTRSYKTIRGRAGEWKVEVTANGQVIETLKFTVTP
ncbi:MAG: DUF2914 domain-containing protein [bacterium]